MEKDDYFCPDCGDPMIKDDGKLVCLKCYKKKPDLIGDKNDPC